MSRLTSISSSPMLREFAQGAAQEAIQPVADFVAPAVEVPTLTGKYKTYTEKNRFRIPKTERALGGRATELRFEASDNTFNLGPHALDYPVDNIEQLEAAGLENMLREGAQAVAEVASLAHEKTVIDAALVAAGGGTNKTWGSTADPVNDIDTEILNVIKAAKYGSLMGVRVLFGANAWRIFKNQKTVTTKFTVSGARFIPAIQEVDASNLFLARPEVRTSFMVYDTAAEGVAESISFLLDATVLIFAAKAQPTRRDPSFMKTFRLMGQWMVPGSYVRDDNRVEVAKFDWTEEVVVSNSAAVKRLNISE